MSEIAGCSSSQNVNVYIDRKGGKVLLHAGHQYTVKRKHGSGLVVWECVHRKKRKCTGLIKLKADAVVAEKSHMCSPDFAANEMAEQIHKCKMAIVSPSYPNVPTAYNNMIANLKDSGIELLQDIPNFSNIKSSLYRHRNKTAEVMRLHNTTSEKVEIPPKYQDFILAEYTDNDLTIFVFCSTKAQELMKNLDDYLSDGTFKSCPIPFEQLYTIHGDLGSTERTVNIIPLVYALMSKRTFNAYEILFRLIKSRIPEWTPKSYKTDYEKAAMKAIAQVFPGVVVKGCYYHFNKCVWRKGRNLGITKSENPSHIREIALSAVLPLLPHTEILNGWNYITRQNSEDENIMKFREYMLNEWIKPTYVEKWSVFGERHRTTNYLEGWHHKLNQAIGKKHPNLMHFLHELQKDSAFYTVRSNQFETCTGKSKIRSKRSILKDEFIQTAQFEFLNGDLSVGHLLEMLRH